MRKIYYYILLMMTFSFSVSFADIEVKKNNIWTETLVENNAPFSFVFDVTIPGKKLNKKDKIFLKIEEFHSGSNKYEVINSNFQVMSGARQFGNELIVLPDVNGSLSDIRLTIEGRAIIKKGDWYSFDNSKVTIGRLTKEISGEKINIYLEKHDLQILTSIEVDVKQILNLGKTIGAGKLSHTALDGHPAKFNVKVKGIPQDKNSKIKLELLDSDNIRLFGNGANLTAKVWFIEGGGNTLEKNLKLENTELKTEEIEVGGEAQVPAGQAKGKYRGKFRMRVTYVEE